MPRLVVASSSGRSGKTTAVLGLLAVLRERGLAVQSYKKGPDFIDSGWASLIAGRPCRNLDHFMLGSEEILKTFFQNSGTADISLVEGAMGLFDGVDIEGSGSTAELAKKLKAPVILVADTTRTTRSIAPLIRGFMDFDPRVKIAGIILNKVAGPRHEALLRESVANFCRLPVLGVIPKDPGLIIPDRHLGLVPASEDRLLKTKVERMGRAFSGCFEVDKILELASSAPELPEPSKAWPGRNRQGITMGKAVIGFFRDRAFSFYYPENMEALAAAGAVLVEINSLKQSRLPDIDGLYIGGGFPEVFAGDLEANGELRRTVKEAVETGLPVYAECGGLMFLSRRLILKEKSFEMAGCLPVDVEMREGPQGHGYQVVEVMTENPFLLRGTLIRGHEFHHSRVINMDENSIRFAFRVVRGTGIDGSRDGILYKNVLAGYLHLHAQAVPGWAVAFVDKAREHRARMERWHRVRSG